MRAIYIFLFLPLSVISQIQQHHHSHVEFPGPVLDSVTRASFHLQHSSLSVDNKISQISRFSGRYRYKNTELGLVTTSFHHPPTTVFQAKMKCTAEDKDICYDPYWVLDSDNAYDISPDVHLVGMVLNHTIKKGSWIFITGIYVKRPLNRVPIQHRPFGSGLEFLTEVRRDFHRFQVHYMYNQYLQKTGLVTGFGDNLKGPEIKSSGGIPEYNKYFIIGELEDRIGYQWTVNSYYRSLVLSYEVNIGLGQGITLRPFGAIKYQHRPPPHSNFSLKGFDCGSVYLGSTIVYKRFDVAFGIDFDTNCSSSRLTGIASYYLLDLVRIYTGITYEGDSRIYTNRILMGIRLDLKEKKS